VIVTAVIEAVHHGTYYIRLSPGVIQLESNLASVGKVSPRSFAKFSNVSASLADL